MLNVMKIFKRKQNIFYEYFLLVSKNIKMATDVYIQMMTDLDNAENYMLQIKMVENMGDQYTHEIMKELNKTFITPLEREDILGLTLQLDDVLDCLEFCSSRIVLYGITEQDDYMRLFTKNIELCVENLCSALELLSQKKLSEMKQYTHKINDLENAADDLLTDALTTLFNNSADAIEIIKKKELYTMMESFSDFCEDVADILEGLIMRNS
ncbi:phosphate transport regulator [Desulfocucumis palustris]|uniref:Phosphate transport regulator n=1 Tax=Desulfocucumis palustris TaxID=1898651 RepID=A0A2L2XAP3_9FIRM|nr:DUF47 family protein [Desulfocucumis palustris]GBF33339.1 phosphate transport regulator [Desulfocucumis palustris]